MKRIQCRRAPSGLLLLCLLMGCRAPCEVWVVEGAPQLRFGIAADRDPWFGRPRPLPLQEARVYRCGDRTEPLWAIGYNPDSALISRGESSHRVPPTPAVLGELVYGVSPSPHYLVRRQPATLAVDQCYTIEVHAGEGHAVTDFRTGGRVGLASPPTPAAPACAGRFTDWGICSTEKAIVRFAICCRPTASSTLTFAGMRGTFSRAVISRRAAHGRADSRSARPLTASLERHYAYLAILAFETSVSS